MHYLHIHLIKIMSMSKEDKAGRRRLFQTSKLILIYKIATYKHETP